MSNRAFGALLSCAMLAGAIVVSLRTQAPDLVGTSLVTPLSKWAPRPIPLLETAGAPPPVYVLRLRAFDPIALLVHREIRIPFTSDKGELPLTSATLAVVGTSCAYETVPHAGLSSNRELTFVQNAACVLLHEAPGGELQLTVHLARRARIAIWTYQPPAEPAIREAAAVQVLSIPGHTGALPVIAARSVVHLPDSGTTRIDLLNYMWQIADRPTWMWWSIAAAIFLCFAGAVTTPHESRPASGPRGLFAARASLGMGFMAAGLALLYAVLVPPFHAPDEPNHFVGYARLTNQPHLEEAAVQWGMVGHFDRLQFRPDEQLRPADIGHPSTTRWSAGWAGNALDRSASYRLWLLVNPYLRHLSVQRTLLALRLLHVLLFTAAVLLGTLVVVWATDIPYPQFAAGAFLMVPSLPFFSMHVSNYGMLASCYVLFALGITAAVLGGRHGHFSGILLGVSAALMFATSRSALPLLVMLGMVAGGRLLLGSRGQPSDARALRSAALFWIGLGAGLATFRWFLDERQYWTYIAGGAYPPEGFPAFAWARNLHLPVGGAILAMAILGAIATEVLLSTIRRRVARRFANEIARLLRIGGGLAAATIAGLMIAPMFVRFPVLESTNPAFRSPSEIYWQAALSQLGWFRWRQPDHLLSSSFWAGFGWLETIPPDWYVGALAVSTGCAMIALVLHLIRRRKLFELAWLVVLAAGFIVTFATYMIVAVKFSPALHGRYLLGLYLAVMPICWAWPVVAAPNAGRWPEWVSRGWLLFAASAAVHTYALSFILRRYF